MIAGVCNGIAAYFNLDPTLVRLAFVLLTIFWGTGVMVYIVLAIVVPEAETPEEKAAASGSPATAQEFIRRAKEGYYEAMKSFPDRKARREWKRRVRREARAWCSGWPHWHGWRWHGAWPEPPATPMPIHPGMSFILPVLSLLQGALTVLWLCALISLLATGMVLGHTLPGNVPTWLATLLLAMAYAIVNSPLKAARRSCSAGPANPSLAWPVMLLLDAVVWLAICVTLIWLAVHYSPQLHAAVENLPTMAQQAAQDIQGWWKAN
jgi:phage shock protein PspC (stress-responsive transcriptional regulator)